MSEISVEKIIERWKGVPLKELLREMYIDRDMTITEISDELCISVGAVHKYLKDYGICKQKGLWNID